MQATPQPPVRRFSSTAAYRAARRRARKKRRTAGLVVMGLLAAGLFLAALLAAQGGGAAPSAVVASSLPVISSAPPVVSSAPSSQAPSRAPTPYDETDAPPLFNYENEIPQSYLDEMELVEISDGQQMERRAAAAFTAMQEAAKEEGITLVALSGYRTHQRQENNYNASIQRYLDWGYSEEEAIAQTEGYYAIPGTSEHEAGLAIDIGDAAVPGANIQDSFASTDAFVWMRRHCTEYGFILRYLEEDFDITHIRYEPWHYRYVGANYAEEIAARGITLEEYLGSVPAQDGADTSSPSGAGAPREAASMPPAQSGAGGEEDN